MGVELFGFYIGKRKAMEEALMRDPATIKRQKEFTRLEMARLLKIPLEQLDSTLAAYEKRQKTNAQKHAFLGAPDPMRQNGVFDES